MDSSNYIQKLTKSLKTDYASPEPNSNTANSLEENYSSNEQKNPMSRLNAVPNSMRRSNTIPTSFHSNSENDSNRIKINDNNREIEVFEMNRSSSFPVQQKPQIGEYPTRNDESSQIPQKEEESDNNNNNNNNNSKDDLDKIDSHSSSESNSNERYLSSFPPPSTQILKMDNTNRFEYLFI
ncbi:unnamed protein product [[Candida] boidinii]|nr:unnamed protein product [[Candida] boidinii]